MMLMAAAGRDVIDGGHQSQTAADVSDAHQPPTVVNTALFNTLQLQIYMLVFIWQTGLPHLSCCCLSKPFYHNFFGISGALYIFCIAVSKATAKTKQNYYA